MSLISGLKKQALVDVIVGVIIVGGTLIFVWSSGLRLPGWDISGKHVKIENEDKVEARDIFIRKDGALSLDESELTLQSSSLDIRGVYLEGASSLSLKNSTIIGDDGDFIISLVEKADGIPSAKIVKSELKHSGGIFLFGRSSLKASDSELGTIFLREKAKLSLENVHTLISITAGEGDVFTDLVPGTTISRNIKSELGWKAELKSCQIDAYQIEIFNEDSIAVHDSSEVQIYFQTPGTLEDSFEIDGSMFSGILDGALETEWFDLKWERTSFSAISILSRGEDIARITGFRVINLDVNDSSELTVGGGTLACSFCTVSQSGVLSLNGISIETIGAITPRFVISGFGQLNVKDSDIRGVDIIVLGGASINLENTQFDDNRLEFTSEGSFTVDGEDRTNGD